LPAKPACDMSTGKEDIAYAGTCRYPCAQGHVAEWLRSGLQIRLRPS
jgi:hypothetical protein